MCDCGNETTVYGKFLLDGRSSSCGCFRKEYNAANPHIKHGHTSGDQAKRHSKTYNSWRSMVQRTTNPNHAQFELWGGRGITVCERWLKFENFLEDMGEHPGQGYSLERMNNNGNYEPSNCRWATISDQNRNRRPYHRKKNRCDLPPAGWVCSRLKDHGGPCAASPIQTKELRRYGPALIDPAVEIHTGPAYVSYGEFSKVEFPK